MEPSNSDASHQQVQYAGFGTRFLAYWVDYLIFFPLGLMIQQMVGNSPFAFFQAQSLSDIEKIQSSSNSILGMAIALLLSLAYYLVFWVNYDGATPGKKLMGIKIVKENGEKMTYPVAFIRLIGNLISAATLFFFGLSYLWVIWDKKKQALHDKIAGTVVIKTDKQPKTVLAVFLTLAAIFMICAYLGAAIFKGFSLGMKAAQENKGAITESVLQEKLKENQEADASKILAFAPSSCGLTIPIPKTTDTNQDKTRKWLYEETPLGPEAFYVLDKDVYPVEKVDGAFLGYKDAASRLEGENFYVGFPGLNIFCVDNTKSFTLDEFVSLALTNKNHKVETKKRTYWGGVELIPITLQGKDFLDIAYLGVTPGDSKLLYIRIWAVADDDPNKTALNDDLGVIVNNLKYRHQEGSSADVKGESRVNAEFNSNVKGANTVLEQIKTK